MNTCYTSNKFMRHLQLPKNPNPFDHCPLFLQLRAQLCHAPEPRQRIDKDMLMSAVINKQFREPFIHKLEETLAAVDPIE